MILKELEMRNENIDLDKYIEFREYVKKFMEHPEWLGDFTKEELLKMNKKSSYPILMNVRMRVLNFFKKTVL